MCSGYFYIHTYHAFLNSVASTNTPEKLYICTNCVWKIILLHLEVVFFYCISKDFYQLIFRSSYSCVQLLQPNNAFDVGMSGFGSDTFQLTPTFGTGSAVLSLSVKKEANIDYEKEMYRQLSLTVSVHFVHTVK